MSLGVSYEVARPTGVCARSGEAISPGDRYIAALYEGDEQLERRDFAASKWADAPRKGLFGYWSATMPEPNEAPKPLVSQGEIAELFTHLGEQLGEQLGEDGPAEPLSDEDRRRLTFRYILALMLMRKRWLRLEGTNRDGAGREVMTLSWAPIAKRAEGETAEVVDPGMDEDAVGEAIDQVGAVMGGLDREGAGP